MRRMVGAVLVGAIALTGCAASGTNAQTSKHGRHGGATPAAVQASPDQVGPVETAPAGPTDAPTPDATAVTVPTTTATVPTTTATVPAATGYPQVPAIAGRHVGRTPKHAHKLRTRKVAKGKGLGR